MDVNRLLDGRLKVRHLVLVVTVAEQGSLVGAAERLRVTQPVVTRGLRELEQILDVELFDRGPRGVTPNAYGRAFVDDARAIVAQIRQAGRHVAELSAGMVGTVVVGNHLSGANVLLPTAIARLKRQFPYVTVVVREATPDRLTEDLLTGDIDLVVGRLTPEADERTRRIRLYHEPVRVVVRAGHPALSLVDPELADLIDYPWVLPVPQTSLRGEVEQVFFRQGLGIPTNRVECTSLPTLRTLLIDADMIATLPALLAKDDPALAVLPVELPNVDRLVGLTLAVGRGQSPSLEAFVRHLEAVGAEIRSYVDTSISPADSSIGQA
ncbi:LysR substrate-binding domain-containing protein [Kutzneria sp. CA-103260]|uniref:LysR substrate-binding domain-containing protein n=1 Tax=Kutzneria sp. CA-103260 TaxID=2802641 RepID=UPI001BADB9AF|nr:LysR substrate-binding domain-containing protein [Kutzneria sp. CA-103260]QUQ65987.1 HTH-type transcriptional regulator HdfR [Kutzneria sp. CA-103260]